VTSVPDMDVLRGWNRFPNIPGMFVVYAIHDHLRNLVQSDLTPCAVTLNCGIGSGSLNAE